ncbi:MAG: PKD domain-containing protein [Bacteroidetes bacterium]|nr:PKD domain-containing protein [Bacteroidota bacterium]
MRKLRWISVLSLLILPLLSRATHVTGAEMFWKHLGNRVFEVHVVYFSDCNLIGNPWIDSLTVDGTSGTMKVPIASDHYDTLFTNRPTCGGNPCTSFVSFIRSEGVFRVDLSQDTSSAYTLHNMNCCRINAMTNLETHGGILEMSIYSKMNLADVDSQYWSSPQFISLQQYTSSAGGIHQVSFMVDDSIQGIDSVSYELVVPYEKNVGVSYFAGYNYKQPLIYKGYPTIQNGGNGYGYNLDPGSGELSFSPMLANRVTVTAVKAKSYRKKNGNWYVASETIRDIVIVTQSSSINYFPYFPNALEDVVFCDSSHTYYDVVVADSNATDTLTLKLFGHVPTYQIQYLGQNGINRTFRINFSLDSSDWKIDEYRLVIQVNDQKCDGTGEGVAQYGLKLLTRMDANWYSRASMSTKRICNTLQASFTGLGVNDPFEWKVNGQIKTKKELNFSLLPDSTYIIQLSSQRYACHLLLSDTVHIDSLYHFTAEFTGFPGGTCLGQELRGRWNTSGGLDSNTYYVQNWIVDTSYLDLLHDTSYYALSVVNASGCSADTLVSVDTFPVLITQVPSDWVICYGNKKSSVIPISASGGTGKYLYIWNDTIQTDSFVLDTDTLSYLQVKTLDSLACWKIDTVQIHRSPKPKYSISGMGPICSNDSFNLAVNHQIPDSLIHYDWGFGKVSNKTIRLKPENDTILLFQLIDTGYCTLQDSLHLHYFGGRFKGLPDQFDACDNATDTMHDSFIGNRVFESWTGEASPQSTSFYRIIPDTVGTWMIHLNIQDADGCAYSDSVHLARHKSPNLDVYPLKLNWCSNDSSALLMDSVVQKYGAWYIDAMRDSLLNPALLSTGYHTIYYLLDSGFCSNHWSTNIRRLSAPTAALSLSHNSGPAPLSVQFNATVTSDTLSHLIWYFNDSTAADTSSSASVTHIYQNPGYYSPAFAVYTDYCSNLYAMDSTVQATHGLGFASFEFARIFPNPFTNDLSIYSSTPIQWVEILEMNGKLIQQIPMNNSLSAELKLGELATGVYVLRLITLDGIQSIRLQKIGSVK